MTKIYCVVFLLVSILAGCGVFPHKIKDQKDPSKILKVPSNNIIMVNAKGRPVDPTGNINCKNPETIPCEGEHTAALDYPEIKTAAEYDFQVKEILRALDKQKTNRILIYIHGGLNTQVGSVDNATKLYEEISQSQSDYFPIFINWQSSLVTSYKNHLLYLRQGTDWRDMGNLGKISGWLTFPFYLLSDLTRAVSRAPMAWAIQTTSTTEIFPEMRESGLGHVFPDLTLAEDVAFQLLCEQNPDKPNIYNNGTDQLYKERYVGCRNTALGKTYYKKENFIPIWIGKRNRDESGLKYILTLPPKAITGPVIDAFGTSSWDSMAHSLSTLFHYDREQVEHIHTTSFSSESNYKTTGALGYFFKKLEQKILFDTQDGKNKWEVVLIGHSAGAIILNEIVKNFGELPIRNIVYMGAAATVKDYENVVLPYLARKNLANNHDAKVRVHHLMLHEVAETGEQNAIDLSPRGSLLVWIDEFLSNPLKRTDYTLGRFVNLMPAIHHTPPELRKFITITKFEAGERRQHSHPQFHGEFDNRIYFWKPKCWGPSEEGELVKECFKPRKND